MFYSSITGGFYDKGIHGKAIPADAVEITSQHHKELLEGQSRGMQISSDPSGMPILIKPTLVVSSAEDNKEEAVRRLVETDWVNQPDVWDTNNSPYLTNRGDFLSYRSVIRAYAAFPVSGFVNWPEVPSAVWST